MKKTIKKLTALTLVFMLLFSASAVPASAASIFDKIASVEVIGEPVVTARELDEYIEAVGKYEWEDDGYYFYRVLSCFEVTLTSGAVIETDEYGFGISADNKRRVNIDAYVNIIDYQAAKEKGEDKIPLTYYATLYSSIDIEMDYRTDVGEAKVVDCYVKSLTPVSGLPDVYRDNGIIGIIMSNYLPEMEEFDIEGAEFDIEYPDGTVVRDTVEWTVDEDGYEYFELNGEEIWYYFDEEESIIVMHYADAYCVYPVEFIPFPVSEIVIDEVKVTDAFEAESVSYTVTKADGSTQSYTYTFDSEPVATVLGMDGYMAESVDGVYIIILVSKGYTDDYPATEVIDVAIFADIDTNASERVEGATQEDNLINRLIYRVRMFLMRIFDFLWYFF